MVVCCVTPYPLARNYRPFSYKRQATQKDAVRTPYSYISSGRRTAATALSTRCVLISSSSLGLPVHESHHPAVINCNKIRSHLTSVRGKACGVSGAARGRRHSAESLCSAASCGLLVMIMPTPSPEARTGLLSLGMSPTAVRRPRAASVPALITHN